MRTDAEKNIRTLPVVDGGLHLFPLRTRKKVPLRLNATIGHCSDWASDCPWSPFTLAPMLLVPLSFLPETRGHSAGV